MPYVCVLHPLYEPSHVQDAAQHTDDEGMSECGGRSAEGLQTDGNKKKRQKESSLLLLSFVSATILALMLYLHHHHSPEEPGSNVALICHLVCNWVADQTSKHVQSTQAGYVVLCMWTVTLVLQSIHWKKPTISEAYVKSSISECQQANSIHASAQTRDFKRKQKICARVCVSVLILD